MKSLIALGLVVVGTAVPLRASKEIGPSPEAQSLRQPPAPAEAADGPYSPPTPAPSVAEGPYSPPTPAPSVAEGPYSPPTPAPVVAEGPYSPPTPAPTAD